MTNIVLHHYDISPFGELARVALGLKELEWQSVIIPNMMPKPDLVELTGNYARTPVLQIGADIYCDTAAILDALEQMSPSPSFYPQPLGDLHRIVAGWASAGQFGAHVGAAMRNIPGEALGSGFVEDRRKRFVGFDFEEMPKFAPHLETQVMAASQRIDALLADGRPFIGGDEPGHGDLALYANAWFLVVMPFAKEFADRVFALSNFSAWYERVKAIGHGKRIESDADTAIKLAASCDPAPLEAGTCEGFEPGQSVLIKTEQSGDHPVAGALLRCDWRGIAISRESERAGKINVHFPRLGQIVIAA